MQQHRSGATSQSSSMLLCSHSATAYCANATGLSCTVDACLQWVQHSAVHADTHSHAPLLVVVQTHAWLQLAQHSSSPLDQLTARQAAAEAAEALPAPERAEYMLEYASWLHASSQAEPGQAEQMLQGAAALLLGRSAAAGVPAEATMALTISETELLVRLFVALSGAAPAAADAADYLMTAQHYAVALLVALITQANAEAAQGGGAGLLVEIPSSLPAWAGFDPMCLSLGTAAAAMATPELVLAQLEALAAGLQVAGRHVHCLPVLQLQRVVAKHLLKCQVGERQWCAHAVQRAGHPISELIKSMG